MKYLKQQDRQAIVQAYNEVGLMPARVCAAVAQIALHNSMGGYHDYADLSKRIREYLPHGGYSIRLVEDMEGEAMLVFSNAPLILLLKIRLEPKITQILAHTLN